MGELSGVTRGCRIETGMATTSGNMRKLSASCLDFGLERVEIQFSSQEDAMKTLFTYCFLLLAAFILSGCASPQSFFYQPSDDSKTSNPPYSLVPKLDSGTGDSDAIAQP